MTSRRVRSACPSAARHAPGLGGTVRTVRLIGAKAALELMLTGKPVRGDKALTGLV